MISSDLLDLLNNMTQEQYSTVVKTCGTRVNWWLRYYGIDNSGTMILRNAIKATIAKHGGSTDVNNINWTHYSKNDFISAVQNSDSYTQICHKLNITVCTFNFERIRSLCSKLELSTDHIIGKNKSNAPKWTEDTVFVENCTITRSALRPTLIRLGFYTGVCSECGITDQWNGKELTIEIDHINGVCTDNRRHNLRWLCPNCHSQTNTYRRKNS